MARLYIVIGVITLLLAGLIWLAVWDTSRIRDLRRTCIDAGYVGWEYSDALSRDLCYGMQDGKPVVAGVDDVRARTEGAK